VEREVRHRDGHRRVVAPVARAAHRLVGLAATLAAVVVLVLVGAPTAASASSVPLGVYAGSRDPLAVAEFGWATGAHLSLATDFLDGSAGWAVLDGASGIGVWASSGYQLVLGVPMLPRHTRSTLGQGARGRYDSDFVTLARNLVDDGEGGAYLRLGWEFNGNWFKWHVRTASAARQYAAYFRNIVVSMRSVPGEDFKFIWNPNAASPTSYTPDEAYPGDPYVDFIGTDVYDSFWGSPFAPQAAWSNQLTQQWGLDWLAAFSAEHGKPIVIPEWSTDYRSDGHGLGDDPYFINQFSAWTSSHDVAWTSMFAFDASDQRNDITDGAFPNSLRAFEADFG